MPKRGGYRRSSITKPVTPYNKMGRAKKTALRAGAAYQRGVYAGVGSALGLADKLFGKKKKKSGGKMSGRPRRSTMSR